MQHDTLRIQLDRNWRFHLGDMAADDTVDYWYRGYDDSAWDTVWVPHDWSVSLPFSQAYSSGTGYLAGGIGWYRLHFSLPEAYRGRCVRVVFDGIYKNARVWCNSSYLGGRPSGYATFSLDLTELVQFGEEADNVLCVKVTHTDLADSRWFTGSGITRKVTLLVEAPVHPAEYGIFFQAAELSGISPDGETAAGAVASVFHTAVNTTDTLQALTIETRLYDGEGAECLCLQGTCRIPAGESRELTLQGRMRQVRLWSADHPVRYRMVTRYLPKHQKESAYLTDETWVGFREVVFDPNEGLSVNGQRTHLKGVCVHHDGGVLGAAMDRSVWQRRLSLLKEAGCNAIRCSHNPHMPELYDLCDAMGFYMMDEAFDEWENPKNKWWQGHNVYPPKHQGSYEHWQEWHARDLADMVRRDRNHPSILLYSIGNEIDYPNDPYCHPSFDTMTGNNDANKPAAERRYDPNKPNMERLAPIARKLVDIVAGEDSSRPATVAAAFPELSTHIGFVDALSVVGYNYKEQFYEADHARFPDKTFLGSENGHSLEAWQAVIDHDYICGQFLWTGIDYLGEAHGWPVHGAPAGLLTTAGLPKPEYYRRKRLWAAETAEALEALAQDPHVATECWRQEAADLLDPARDAAAEAHATSLSMTLWQAEDVLSGKSYAEEAARPGYVCQVILRLTDAQGRIVRCAEEEIAVTVEGAGELMGLDSGDLADTTSFTKPQRRTFRGELVAYIRRTEPGAIHVRATAASAPVPLRAELTL
ncbi:MAG: glycoside hydrolase family 2 [Butyrivibrio sp.]|nr:glycoside hydrolase family 2 [Butyrivibrio sp.]